MALNTISTGGASFGPSSNRGLVPDQWSQYNPQYALGVQQLAQQQNQWADKLKLYYDVLSKRNTQTGQLSDIVGEYNKAFAEAKSANETKYQQALGLTDQVSGQQAADIRSEYAKQRSSALSNLARTGMSNTTVGNTLSQGLKREEVSSLNRLADQMLQSKLGVMQNFEYKYPETAIPTSLISALSQNISWPSL